MRDLAAILGVDPSHLSRGLRRTNGKKLSDEMVLRIEEALELPVGHFPETRAALVTAAARDDAQLRDRMFNLVDSSRVRSSGRPAR